MVKDILKQVKIDSFDDKYILDKHYKFELSLEEIKQFKKNISKQIETCENEIKKCEGNALDIAIVEVIKKLEAEYESKKEALQNFQKYQHETILKFKQNSEKQRKELLDFCNKEVFEEYKKLVIKGLKDRLEKDKENYFYQLKDLKEQIKAYEKY